MVVHTRYSLNSKFSNKNNKQKLMISSIFLTLFSETKQDPNFHSKHKRERETQRYETNPVDKNSVTN